MVYVNRKTRDWLGRALVWVIVGAAAFAAFGLLQDCLCAPVAEAEEGESYEVTAAIRTLQPATTPERAARLAGIFEGAGHETRLDPLLLVAIAMRESSLREDVLDGRVRGSRGEIGAMQIHGVALRFAPNGCDPLNDVSCNIRTGARFLAFIRETCNGSWFRWVSAYGRSRCPTEETARTDVTVIVALRYYTEAGGSLWR